MPHSVLRVITITTIWATIISNILCLIHLLILSTKSYIHIDINDKIDQVTLNSDIFRKTLMFFKIFC